MLQDVNELSQDQQQELLLTLQNRFEQNMVRHEGKKWNEIVEKLNSQPEKLVVLYKMEQTEGEPDVVFFGDNQQLAFVDCSKESPKGHRSVCFDEEARSARKKHPPEYSAMKLAQQMGIELLTELQYRQLQHLGEFDLKTSSWVQTPENIRALGGALFCDRRYDTVFVYHNGADSYYSSRGFRGFIYI